MTRARPKVVLFHPRVARPELHRIPWSVLTVAGNLDAQRFEVRIVDGGKVPDPIQALLEAAEGALVVGISCFTGNQTIHAIAAARALRRRHPAVPIVWGGAHPSMYPEQTLADPLADIVVRGQGEAAFARVVDALADGTEPKNIPGVSYKRGRGEMVIGPKAKFLDQHSFGRPPFEQIDPRRYLVHIMVGRRGLTYHSSTGCPYQCQFCTVNFEFNFGWSGYGAERVIAELRELFARAPEADAIEFADSNLVVDRRRLVAIAEGLIAAKLNKPWIGFARPDQLAKLPREVWALLRRSGCRRFFVGIESGDPAVLKKVKKEHSLEEIYRMAERMAEFGIEPDLSFTLGYPEDPGRDIEMSLALAKDLKRIVPGAIFVLNSYTPYESTPLYGDAVLHGLARTQTLSDWEREEWRNFGFRKAIAPWMTEALDRRIRDFEVVAQTAFFRAEDLYRHQGVARRAAWAERAMIALAERRWSRGDFDSPLDVKVARKVFFALNPGLADSVFVEAHRAGTEDAPIPLAS